MRGIVILFGFWSAVLAIIVLVFFPQAQATSGIGTRLLIGSTVAVVGLLVGDALTRRSDE